MEEGAPAEGGIGVTGTTWELWRGERVHQALNIHRLMKGHLNHPKTRVYGETYLYLSGRIAEIGGREQGNHDVRVHMQGGANYFQASKYQIFMKSFRDDQRKLCVQ